MEKNRIENSLKRFLKRKIKITLGLMIAFMITGTVGYAEFKIEDIEDGKKLTGTENESFTEYKPSKHGGLELKDFKEIHINVEDKSGLKTWSGRFNLPDTDLYITVTGNTSNSDGIHLTNHGPNIILNKYVANIDSPISDALNISRDCTHPGDAPIPYADINYLEATIKQGHGIRANSTIADGRTVIRINNSANIKIAGGGYTAVFAGCDETLRDSSKGKGEIYLNGITNIVLSADKTSGIWAGRNGYIEVGNLTITGENNDSKGIVVNDKSINGFIFGGQNKYGSTVLLKGDKVTINLNSGKAFYADSKYAKISSKDNKEILYDIKGDIETSNKGEITLNAKENSSIIGKIDDKRYNKNSGTVNITFNGGKWESTGKSFVSKIDLKSKTDIIFKEKGTSIDIQNLKGNGNGNFVMNVNSENKADGNMLYIQNSEGGKYTINLQNSDLSKIKVGDTIRFATIGENAKNNNLKFKATDIKEQGIKNISFKVESDDFVVGEEENKIYNDGENKSGNDYVEKNYINGENWYITRTENTEDTNDIGTTIIEMSKANYAGAVYMDNLNKRVGDMTFVDGDEGLWVRLRNDRVGEDNEYRLINYMTQLGYMKKSYDENGTTYRGIAGEITRGDMEFKNITGDATIDRHSISLYDTKLYNNGFYHDYVARVGRLENDFDIQGRETGNKAEGNYKNLFAGVSAEYGYRHNINNNWYVEPQGQLQYTYIDDTDYTTNQDTKVKLEDIHSLIGRVGFRLGYDRYSEDKKVSTFYVKADVNHEFAGDQKVEAKDKTGSINKKYDNSKTWYDVGVGITSKVNESMDVYADIEKQFGSERDSKSWQFNMGFKYKF